jgi:predicted RNA binding protein YcfA (HicA-like mRNA interferase family)
VRDVDAAVRALRRQGYEVKRSKGSNHWHVRKGGRLLAVTSSTPGDWKALRNLKGQLRRAEAGR